MWPIWVYRLEGRAVRHPLIVFSIAAVLAAAVAVPLVITGLATPGDDLVPGGGDTSPTSSPSPGSNVPGGTDPTSTPPPVSESPTPDPSATPGPGSTGDTGVPGDTDTDVIGDLINVTPGPVGVTIEGEPLCSIPDAYELLSPTAAYVVDSLTGQFWFDYKDWISNNQARMDDRRIQSFLASQPVRVPQENLTDGRTHRTVWDFASAGIFARVADDVNQTLIVAYDPAYLSPADVTALRNGLEGVHGGLNVVIRPGCNSIADLARAWDVMTALDWHPEAKNGGLAAILDAATGTILIMTAAGSLPTSASR